MFYFRHFIHITNIEAMKSVCGDLILVNDTVTEGRVNGDSNFIRLILYLSCNTHFVNLKDVPKYVTHFYCDFAFARKLIPSSNLHNFTIF